MIRIAKYLFAGSIAAAVDFSIFAALLSLLYWPWYVAATISFITGTLVNYFISIRHVFTSGVRFGRRDEIALTFLVSAVGLAVNQAIMYFLIQWRIAVLLAKVGATAVVFVWNYSARNYFVFKEEGNLADP